MSRRTRKLLLPPGPKPDPLIGHLRVLPTSDEHLVYTRWAKELNSNITSITVFGQTFIVLNSVEAANELLDKRSTIYSSRPRLPMITYPDLVDWSKLTGLLPYGDRWRAQRRVSQSVLHKTASVQLWPSLVKESRLALQRISINPDNFVEDIRRMTGSILLSTVYGYKVTSTHDRLVKLVETSIDHLSSAGVPGNFLVNTIPWLRYFPDWFPGAGWKKTVKAWKKEKDEVINIPFDWTKQQIACGTAEHSIVKSLLAELENKPNEDCDNSEDEEIIKWATGNLFGAGADTTAASLLVFILAMTLNPHIQAKAQAEVDRVLGQDRLPEMDDREFLPYVECVLKEVERWQPVVPLGIAHASTEDDEYRGYFIPKGAVVIGNLWAITRNKLVYCEPDRFDPDRFLDPRVPKAPAFGFGRRSCPGLHMAESTLFITISTFLMLFDVRPIKDEEGKEIPPEVNMKTNALVSYPADFRCSITPRSERALKLLGLSVLGTDG
ncbi:cytochrome P450, partial [Rhizoctonia solani]